MLQIGWYKNTTCRSLTSEDFPEPKQKTKIKTGKSYFLSFSLLLIFDAEVSGNPPFYLHIYVSLVSLNLVELQRSMKANFENRSHNCHCLSVKIYKLRRERGEECCWAGFSFFLFFLNSSSVALCWFCSCAHVQHSAFILKYKS